MTLVEKFKVVQAVEPKTTNAAITGSYVSFEKENVNTLDSKGDFMLTLLGSLAQEESNSISQASRQGIVYRFQAGKVLVNHNKFLGYTKDENGELVIDPVQAETVKRIYSEYLDGKSCNKIAQRLERNGVLTGFNRTRWHESTVKKILKNENYIWGMHCFKRLTQLIS